MKSEIATFGAGCFWGVEERFRVIPGVSETAVGYMGGETVDPSHEDVSYKNTGHVEVLQLTFDPDQVSYFELLSVFWDVHDPTQLDRQGPDVGRQYRSVIFHHSARQKEIATESKAELMKEKEVVTAIESAATFYRAEEHHQRYLEKRGGGVCHT